MCHLLSLPLAAQDREQLKIELQQVNQQITQQTQMHSMEVCIHSNLFSFICLPENTNPHKYPYLLFAKN